MISTLISTSSWMVKKAATEVQHYWTPDFALYADLALLLQGTNQQSILNTRSDSLSGLVSNTL